MSAAQEDAVEHQHSPEREDLVPYPRDAANASAVAITSDRLQSPMGPLNALYQYRRKLAALDQGQLLSRIFRCARDCQPADDLLQEVYERLLRVDGIRAAKIRSVQKYAFGVLRHVVHDWRQRRRNSRIDYLGRTEDLAATDHYRDVEEVVAAQQEIRLLSDEIARLPARCRKVLLLVKVFGYSAKEVAVELGIAESTVKKQLQIAAVRCHDALNSASTRPGLFLLSKALGRRRVRL